MFRHPLCQQLTAERRHYLNCRLGHLRLRAVRDADGNRALWAEGGGCIRLIYPARPKKNRLAHWDMEWRRLPSGRYFQVCYRFNPVLVYFLGQKPLKVLDGFFSKIRTGLNNRLVKKRWLTAQSRHYHNFILADGHRITLNRYRGKGQARTLNKWIPGRMVYRVIASRKRFMLDADGHLSMWPLNGALEWTDTYYPERYDMWPSYIVGENKAKRHSDNTFTQDAAF